MAKRIADFTTSDLHAETLSASVASLHNRGSASVGPTGEVAFGVQNVLHVASLKSSQLVRLEGHPAPIWLTKWNSDVVASKYGLATVDSAQNIFVWSVGTKFSFSTRLSYHLDKGKPAQLKSLEFMHQLPLNQSTASGQSTSFVPTTLIACIFQPCSFVVFNSSNQAPIYTKSFPDTLDILSPFNDHLFGCLDSAVYGPSILISGSRALIQLENFCPTASGGIRPSRISTFHIFKLRTKEASLVVKRSSSAAEEQAILEKYDENANLYERMSCANCRQVCLHPRYPAGNVIVMLFQKSVIIMDVSLGCIVSYISTATATMTSNITNHRVILSSSDDKVLIIQNNGHVLVEKLDTDVNQGFKYDMVSQLESIPRLASRVLAQQAFILDCVAHQSDTAIELISIFSDGQYFVWTLDEKCVFRLRYRKQAVLGPPVTSLTACGDGRIALSNNSGSLQLVTADDFSQFELLSEISLSAFVIRGIDYHASSDRLFVWSWGSPDTVANAAATIAVQSGSPSHPAGNDPFDNHLTGLATMSSLTAAQLPAHVRNECYAVDCRRMRARPFRPLAQHERSADREAAPIVRITSSSAVGVAAVLDRRGRLELWDVATPTTLRPLRELVPDNLMLSSRPARVDWMEGYANSARRDHLVLMSTGGSLDMLIVHNEVDATKPKVENESGVEGEVTLTPTYERLQVAAIDGGMKQARYNAGNNGVDGDYAQTAALNCNLTCFARKRRLIVVGTDDGRLLYTAGGLTGLDGGSAAAKLAANTATVSWRQTSFAAETGTMLRHLSFAPTIVDGDEPSKQLLLVLTSRSVHVWRLQSNNTLQHYRKLSPLSLAAAVDTAQFLRPLEACWTNKGETVGENGLGVIVTYQDGTVRRFVVVPAKKLDVCSQSDSLSPGLEEALLLDPYTKRFITAAKAYMSPDGYADALLDASFGVLQKSAPDFRLTELEYAKRVLHTAANQSLAHRPNLRLSDCHKAMRSRLSTLVTAAGGPDIIVDYLVSRFDVDAKGSDHLSDALRCCLIASTAGSSSSGQDAQSLAARGTYKLVATQLQSIGRVQEAVDTLSCVGLHAEACKVLQSDAKASSSMDAIVRAKLNLDEMSGPASEYRTVLKKWLDRELAKNQTGSGGWASRGRVMFLCAVLLTVGRRVDAISLLHTAATTLARSFTPRTSPTKVEPRLTECALTPDSWAISLAHWLCETLPCDGEVSQIPAVLRHEIGYDYCRRLMDSQCMTSAREAIDHAMGRVDGEKWGSDDSERKIVVEKYELLKKELELVHTS